MTHSKNAPNSGRLTTTVASFVPSPNSPALRHDASTGKPRSAASNSDSKCRCSPNFTMCKCFGQLMQSAWRSMLALLGSLPSRQPEQNPSKNRVLMCFSRIEGKWYCAFFDEGALYKRLPPRLTYHDAAKVYETARRGHAQLEDPTGRQDFESALAAGRGKIWLRLTREQRNALEQNLAVQQQASSRTRA
jgi:hypothetical protein